MLYLAISRSGKAVCWRHGMNSKARHIMSEVCHVIEVAFGANIHMDIELLAQVGSIATYATNHATPEIPVWLLVFNNARLFL